MEPCDCHEFAVTLAKTDSLIHSLLEDDRELSDQLFLSKLQELRREHKKSLKLIEDLYKEKLAETEQHHGVGRFRTASDSIHFDDIDLTLGADIRRTYLDVLKKSNSHHYVTFQDEPSEDRDQDGDDDGSENRDDSIGGSFISDSYFPQDWDRLTIEDVIQSARSLLLEADQELAGEGDQIEAESVEKLGTKWAPGVTVPKPFRMTIREDAKPFGNRETFSQRFLDKLLEAKKMQLASELSRPKFKARPVPANTRLPLYDDLLKKTDERRRYLREYCREHLKQTLKPFNLTKSKGIFAHSRRCTSMENLAPGDGNVAFKAQPVPEEVISEAVDIALRQHEIDKLERRKQRAEELLKIAQLPPNMQMTDKEEYRKALQDKRHKNKCLEQWSFKPHIHRTVPNFQALQLEFQQNLAEAKIKGSKATVPQPFALHTANVKQHKHNHEIHKQAVKRHHSNIRRSKSWASSLDDKYKQAVRQNTAAILRAAATKRTLKEIEQDNREAVKRFQIRMEIENQLKQKLKEKIIDEDIAREIKDKERRENRRDALKSGKEKHKEKMTEILDKVAERPTVLDRQKLLVAKQSAEVRYKKALKAAGLPTNIPMPSFTDITSEKKSEIEIPEDRSVAEESPKYSGDEEASSSSEDESAVSKSTGGKKSPPGSRPSSSKRSQKSGSSSADSSLSKASQRTKTISSKKSSTTIVHEETIVHNTKTEGTPPLATNDDDDDNAIPNFPEAENRSPEAMVQSPTQPNVRDIFDD